MLDNLRARIALAVLPKAANGERINPFQVISTRSPDIPIYTDMTVRKSTREGYKTSIYVFRAVRVIVQAASAIPWIVEDKNGEPIDNHPLTKVLRNPNPEFSGQDMMEILIGHELLVGNALWMPIILGRQVKEFWPVMPDLVRPIPSNAPGEWLKGWEVSSQDGSKRILPPDQFLHFMQMDPGDLYWGIGPLMAAARTIDTDNEAQDMQKISMQNRAMPDGVFTHESVLTQEQFEEARRQVRENFLGKTKTREPWVLGAGAKWNQLSMTPREIDYIASRLSGKRDIAGAFGISPIFLGDLEQSSYNNMMEARKALYEDVVIPLLDDAKSTLNLKIAPLYGDITISYDTSKVAALREDFTKKVEQAKNLWAMGVPFDQINERLEMGFEEFPGWDTGYLPMMLLPIGSPAREEEAEKNIVDSLGLHRVKALDLSTEEQKVVHWKRIDQRRVAWWGVVNKTIKPLYDDELRAVEKAIKGKAPSKLVDAAKNAIQGLSPSWEKTLTAISAALIEDFGNEIADDLGAGKSDKPPEAKWVFDPFSAIARACIVKNGAESIKKILITNSDDVKRVILAGLDENQTTPQIAKNIRQSYIDHSPFKAMRAARTEVSHAAGFGQREAARQSGVAKKKLWISSRDDRVRDDHITMDTGEWIDFNEPYPSPSGDMYPGESDIMCRCAEAYGTGR